MKIHNPKTGTQFAYNAGVDARDADHPKAAPGGLGAERKSWWLAGWNDRDIELARKATADPVWVDDYYPGGSP